MHKKGANRPQPVFVNCPRPAEESISTSIKGLARLKGNVVILLVLL